MQCSIPLYIGRVSRTLHKISPLSCWKDFAHPTPNFSSIIHRNDFAYPTHNLRSDQLFSMYILRWWDSDTPMQLIKKFGHLKLY